MFKKANDSGKNFVNQIGEYFNPKTDKEPVTQKFDNTTSKVGKGRRRF